MEQAQESMSTPGPVPASEPQVPENSLETLTICIDGVAVQGNLIELLRKLRDRKAGWPDIGTTFTLISPALATAERRVSSMRWLSLFQNASMREADQSSEPYEQIVDREIQNWNQLIDGSGIRILRDILAECVATLDGVVDGPAWVPQMIRYAKICRILMGRAPKPEN